jgi:hypothetical protein
LSRQASKAHSVQRRGRVKQEKASWGGRGKEAGQRKEGEQEGGKRTGFL